MSEKAYDSEERPNRHPILKREHPSSMPETVREIMKYEEIKDMGNGDFRRLPCVRKITFRKMAESVVRYDNERKKSGCPLILSYEDQVLMTLGYSREYRTYFRISADYGMSGSNCYKLIKKTENILVISEDFRLPDRKKPAKSNTEIEAVLIDAAETPTERPEKRQQFYYSGKKDIL